MRGRHAALDFIEQQKSVVAIGKFTRFANERFRHREDTAFALNEFRQNAGRVVADHLLERANVVSRNESRARQQRLEVFTIFRLAGN